MRKTKNLRVKMLVRAGLILLFFTSVMVYAVDRVEVPLTNPSKPALVKVNILRGSIFVMGTAGKQVIVESTSREQKKAEVTDEKAKGMKLIRSSLTGLEVEEEENVVSVRTSAWSGAVDLTIQVPYSTALNLKTLNDGKIKVEKVSGELEVNNLNGPITMDNVSGTVVAHTLNGGVTVTFDKINLDKPMSFSTLNGEIDVTFPKNLKANVKMKTSYGDIYSDFEITMKQGPAKVVKKSKEEGGKFKVSFDKTQYGVINGGGEEFNFKTLHGNIYIRAKK